MQNESVMPSRGFGPHHNQHKKGSKPSGNVDGNFKVADDQIEDPTTTEPCYCGGCEECAELLLFWEIWGNEPIESDDDIESDAIERAINAPDEIRQTEQAEEGCFQLMTRRGF